MSPDESSKMDHRSTTGERPTPKDYPKSGKPTAKKGSFLGTRFNFRTYTAKPSTDREARIQGLAMLQSVLNDPKAEIFKSILDWDFQHTIAERSMYVEMMLTGEKADHDKAFQQLIKGKGGRDVAFIIATWCMLGGNIASTWAEGEKGQKPGKGKPLTDWGKKMIKELQLLGRTAHVEFDFCKPYATGKICNIMYGHDAASAYFQYRLNPERVGATKHAADFSPENPDPAKRRKTTAPRGQTQQKTGSQAPNEAQLKTLSEQPDGAATNQEDDRATTDGLLVKLSREQLEVMNRVLKSKVDRLEKQSALHLESVDKWRTRAITLQDIVDAAANHGTDTLNLVQANIDLRKKNHDEEQMIAIYEFEACRLKKEIASLNQALLNLRNERETLEGRVSNLRDEGETLEGRVRDLNAQVRDKETLLEENTKLRADLEEAKKETAQVKRWLNNVEVETITRIPGTDVVRKSTMKLKEVP